MAGRVGDSEGGRQSCRFAGCGLKKYQGDKIAVDSWNLKEFPLSIS